MKQEESIELLNQKRENFRVSIRRKRNEELFNENRKKASQNSKILNGDKQYSESQELHKYLIADQTKFNEKIIEVFNNGEVMRELIEKCIKQDYYSLLILSNVVTSECDLIKQWKGQVLKVFCEQVGKYQSENYKNLKFLETCIWGIKNLFSLTMDEHLLIDILNSNITQTIYQICSHLTLNENLSIQEEQVIDASLFYFLNLLQVFKTKGNQYIHARHLFQKNGHRVEKIYQFGLRVLLMDKGQGILIMDCCRVLMHIKKITKPLSGMYIKKIIEQVNSKQSKVVLTSLEFMNGLLEAENSVIGQQLIFNGLVNALNQSVYNCDKRIRTQSIKLLTNLVNSKEDSIQKAVTDRDLFLDLVNVFNTTNDQDIILELSYLFYNWIFLSSDYLTKEFIQDSKLNTFIQKKILEIDNVDILENLLLIQNGLIYLGCIITDQQYITKLNQLYSLDILKSTLDSILNIIQ